MSGTGTPPNELEEAERLFIEDFSYAWWSAGNNRMDGRVLGLLLITDAPFLSSARIAELLSASAGAVSMSTRALVNVGFLRPHRIPADRNRYFRVDADVWGGFLAGEREYLRRVASTITFGLDLVGDTPSPRRQRLENAELYMTWLLGYHAKMLEDWEQYRDAHERARAEDDAG